MAFDVRKKSVAFALLFCSSLFVSRADAAIGASTPRTPAHIFYSDPVNGRMDGDGSQTKPWGSLSQIVNAGMINGQDLTSGKIHAGDLIYLMNGNHGTVRLYATTANKYKNTDFITIQAMPNHQPVVERLQVLYCSNWAFRGLSIRNPPLDVSGMNLAALEHSTNIIFDGNTVVSSPNFASWSPADWALYSAPYGIYVNGSMNCTISNNTVQGIENGILLDGDSHLCKSNRVDYFANDGLEFTSHNTLITLNQITNHYGLWDTGLHADGMQGWVAWYDTYCDNVTIDKNIVIASTGAYSTIPAVPTGVGNDILQGISIFDGDWRNVTVTNNAIAAANWHGLSLYGVTGAVIENNTVIQQGPYKTWLGVFNRKDGTPSTNVIVRNNIANNYNLPATGVTIDHNLTFTKLTGTSATYSMPVADPVAVFIKYDPTRATFDLRLKATGPAVGVGSSSVVPECLYDIQGWRRDLTKMNLGAYSYAK